MSNEEKGRTIVRTASTEFGTYHWQPEKQDISFLKLSYDAETQQGSYMMRMQPGAETEIHVHNRREEYFIIEGDLIEPDGTVLGPGDSVQFEVGTSHNSRTVKGCLIIAIDYSWSDSRE